MEIYRCRKCRQNLSVQNAVIKEIEGCKDWNSSQCSVLYLDVDLCPPWIVASVKQASWIKGKLLCPKCRGRLGSFDFVNQKYCGCKQQHTLPVIHLLRDRIDEVQKRVSISPLSQRPHYRDVINMQKTAIKNQCSASGDTVSRAAEDSKNKHSVSKPAKADSEIYYQNTRSLSENLEVNCLNINHRQTPENCCGQVDSFDDLGEARVENLSNLDDWSEARVSGYNRFDVLSVEENEPMRTGGETIVTTVTLEQAGEELYIPPELTCAVCLEMFCRPHRCEPCGHMFCEHCLRQISRQTPTLTPCPLCRNIICKCVFQNDLTERIQMEFKIQSKQIRHETRSKRMEKYPLPGCMPNRYAQHLQNQRRLRNTRPMAHRNEQTFIITVCLQEILVRLAWLLLLFFLHNILLRLDGWFMWNLYTEYSVNFNQFLWTLTCKLILFGVIYCVKKCFYINMQNHFMGQAVLFVFLFSMLWDCSSLIQCTLNMIVLGSLFL